MLPCSTITLLILDYKGSKFFISNYIIFKFPFGRRFFQNFTRRSPDQVPVLRPFPATTLGSIPSQRGLKLHIYTPAWGRVSRGRLQTGPRGRARSLARSHICCDLIFGFSTNSKLRACDPGATSLASTGVDHSSHGAPETRAASDQSTNTNAAINHPDGSSVEGLKDSIHNLPAMTRQHLKYLH